MLTALALLFLVLHVRTNTSPSKKKKTSKNFYVVTGNPSFSFSHSCLIKPYFWLLCHIPKNVDSQLQMQQCCCSYLQMPQIMSVPIKKILLGTKKKRIESHIKLARKQLTID